ncbi:hypothetical protein FIBSPDRAFT_954727 [Athelia psychrophila]|uniref:Uncharacterized protein n=1 Tax=Athelia psychrophila TaxID=1759441 RepID=A0A166J0G9_9AGAM|nr:hypothetical protein FIBSPDRAFT_954727 [Fibularhizoctonia sp. CBS 109695]
MHVPEAAIVWYAYVDALKLFIRPLSRAPAPRPHDPPWSGLCAPRRARATLARTIARSCTYAVRSTLASGPLTRGRTRPDPPATSPPLSVPGHAHAHSTAFDNARAPDPSVPDPLTWIGRVSVRTLVPTTRQPAHVLPPPGPPPGSHTRPRSDSPTCADPTRRPTALARKSITLVPPTRAPARLYLELLAHRPHERAHDAPTRDV